MSAGDKREPESKRLAQVAEVRFIMEKSYED
jgi:hypothetical protein